MPVRVGDDLEACRAPVRDHLAFYVGGMGARDKNFYNDYVGRMGYEDAARKVQDLFLSGQRKEATRRAAGRAGGQRGAARRQGPHPRPAWAPGRTRSPPAASPASR